MSADREAKCLRAQEIDRATGQESGHGRTRVSEGVNQQESEAGAQTEKEERHGSGSNSAGDRQSPRKPVSGCIFAFVGDYDCVGHGESFSKSNIDEYLLGVTGQ